MNDPNGSMENVNRDPEVILISENGYVDTRTNSQFSQNKPKSNISLIVILLILLAGVALTAFFGDSILSGLGIGSKSCEYQGQTYKPGESVPSIDNCNSCTCDVSGQVACTAMACLDDENLDEENSDQQDTTNGNETSPGIAETFSMSGVLRRIERPSPEINYDYELILSEPYFDELNAMGPRDIESIVVVPENDLIKADIEKYFADSVEIEGKVEWGLAETRHLLAKKVTPVE